MTVLFSPNMSPSKPCPKAAHCFLSRDFDRGARLQRRLPSIRLRFPGVLNFGVGVEADDQALKKV